jgi:hypothetical protein
VAAIRQVVGAVGALALLAACGGGGDSGGGDSEFAQESASAIEKASIEDMKALETVQVEGSIDQPDSKVELDLTLIAGGDCQGTISVGDSGSAEVVKAEGSSWFKPDQEFWKVQMGPAAEKTISVVGDNWVQLPEGDESFTSFCDLEGLVDQIESDTDTPAEKDGTEELDGQETVKLTRDDKASGGTVSTWVAVEDPHHILKAEQAGGDGPGGFTFSEFDEDASIEPPADDQVITVEELQQQTQQ